MPGRKTRFVIGGYYHIYNRGVNKQEIFLYPFDYKRFQKTFYYYQFTEAKIRFSKFTKSDLNLFQPVLKNKLVEIICYCLMPNHFHFLLKQLKENGISIFLSQLSNSYTKYFNTKYRRTGPLLQGVFKDVAVKTDEQLLHLSRYIHLNPLVAGLTNDLQTYSFSSFPEFLSNNPIFSSPTEILRFFESKDNYLQFIKDQISYAKSLNTLKHQKLNIDE